MRGAGGMVVGALPPHPRSFIGKMKGRRGVLGGKR